MGAFTGLLVHLYSTVNEQKEEALVPSYDLILSLPPYSVNITESGPVQGERNEGKRVPSMVDCLKPLACKALFPPTPLSLCI